MNNKLACSLIFILIGYHIMQVSHYHSLLTLASLNSPNESRMMPKTMLRPIAEMMMKNVISYKKRVDATLESLTPKSYIKLDNC